MKLLVGLACALACGCGEPARIQLVPVRVGDSTCGRPADVRSMIVAAQGEFAEDVRSVEVGAAVAIDDFPAGTRQLEVQVLGAGGQVAAFGRTAPLDLAALEDGAEVPIFMAPPDDGCPVGDLSAARDRPIVVAAGDGALVLGGGVLGTAEWYDPARGAFEPVETPQAFDGPQGAAGVAAATLPDGRVVVLGGARPIYTVFDPATRTFEPPGALFEVRAHAAAVALDETRVLVAGGCGMMQDGACVAGTEQTRTFVVDLASGAIVDGPELAAPRVGGAALLEPDLGDGARALLVGGDVDAERVDVEGGAVAALGGAGAAAAPLASGSTVALAADGGVAVIVPGVDVARDQGTSIPRAAPALAPLEDGEVLIVGGAAPPVARYRASDGDVVVTSATPVGLDGTPLAGAHRAVRLPDGTVLVVAADTAGAWVYRPAGDHPFTGAVTVTPSPESDAPLVPLDPAAVSLAPYTLTDAAGWVVIGGMRPRDLELSAIVEADAGAAVIVGFVAPGAYDAIELEPGVAARLVRHAGGAREERCRGEAVAAADLRAIAVTIRAGELDVRLGERSVLRCAHEARAGLVGFAALGDGAQLTLSTVSVTR